MRKYFILIGLITSFCASAFSQVPMEVVMQKKMDSIKRLVPNLTGIPKVDGMNRIVSLYQLLDDDNQMQVDSATPYARQAINEAKRIGYKRGLGYANLKLSYCEILRANIYLRNNKKNEPGLIDSIEELIQQAMQTAEDIKDNIMIGSAYISLARLEILKGNKENVILLSKKSIENIEKTSEWQQKDGYKEMEYTFCNSCLGYEFWIAEIYMGMIFFQKNKSEANEYLKLAISYYEKAGSNSDMMGNAYLRYARMVGVSSNTETAIEYFKKAIPHFQLSGNKQEELGATTMVCASYWAAGDFENGFEYSKESISLAEKLAKENPPNLNKAELGRAYYWMGRFYSAAGDYETALKVTKKGQGYFSDDPGWKGNWSTLMGDIYRRMKNYDSSMHYLSAFENGTEPSNGKLYLAILYTDLKQYDKALPLINIVLENSKQNESLGNLGHDYSERAAIWLGKKNYKAALNDARLGFTLLTQAKRNSELVNNCRILSDIFNKIGKYDSAYYYLKQNTMLKDSFLSRQFYIRLNDYKKQAEEERRTSQINLLNKDNQLKEQKIKQQAFIKNGLIIGILLLILLGVFVIRSLTLKRRNDKLRMQKNLEVQQLESEKKQAELEMQALRAQMNPHFIFNCLSSINRFILKNESKIASNYLTRFSRLMRMVLINSQKTLIALDDELQMLEIYLEMERLRFKDSFDYGITYLNSVDSDNVFIPPLLLQPFCENAIWHGLMHKEGPGRLDIELSMQDNILNCIITDNGVGREIAEEMNSKTAKKEKSMGLKITTERLALLNREKGLHTFYEIEDLKDENGNAAGTKVVLKISFKESIVETV